MQQPQQQVVFAEGLRVFRVSDGAPTWMKCELVIDDPNAFHQWALANLSGDGKLRLTVCQGRQGGLYAKLNSWQPKPRAQQQAQGYSVPQAPTQPPQGYTPPAPQQQPQQQRPQQQQAPHQYGAGGICPPQNRNYQPPQETMAQDDDVPF